MTCITTALATGLHLVFIGRVYVCIIIAAGFLVFLPLFVLLGGLLVVFERSQARWEAVRRGI